MTGWALPHPILLAARTFKFLPALVLTLLLVTAPTAQAANTDRGDDLVQVTATNTTMPGPGHESTWTIQIEKTVDTPVGLSLILTKVIGDSTMLLRDMNVDIYDIDGTLLFSGRGDSFGAGRTIDLGTLTAQHRTITGVISLAQEATNLDQGLDAALDFQVIATQDNALPPRPAEDKSALPRTGIDLTALPLFIFFAITVGAVLLRRPAIRKR